MTEQTDLPVLLIVEDDEGLQRQLKWAYEGYRVVSAGARATAIELVRLHEPSVVTLDLGLPPDSDGTAEGFATLTEILALKPDTKIIVASAPCFSTASATVSYTGRPRACWPPFPGVTPATIFVPYSIRIWRSALAMLCSSGSTKSELISVTAALLGRSAGAGGGDRRSRTRDAEEVALFAEPGAEFGGGQALDRAALGLPDKACSRL